MGYQIIKHGLRMDPEKLTRREKMDILDDVEALIDEGHDPANLVNAARFGMDKVWPFSEGQSWDSRDFRDNVTKAKSAASRLRRAGRLPTPADEVRDD